MLLNIIYKVHEVGLDENSFLSVFYLRPLTKIAAYEFIFNNSTFGFSYEKILTI